jgi:hypothetical protein
MSYPRTGISRNNDGLLYEPATSFREIGKALGVPTSTVQRDYAIAMEKLRRNRRMIDLREDCVLLESLRPQPLDFEKE